LVVDVLSSQIADIIQVGIGTVNRDLAFLNKQAQDNLKTHIQEKLPEQYQKCINGLNQVLKMGCNIVNGDSSSPANRLQALALVSDSYKYQMDLTTNGVVITDAVQGQMDHLNIAEKRPLQDIKRDQEQEERQIEMEQQEQQQKTFNGVF
jgi:hypothetical protein